MHGQFDRPRTGKRNNPTDDIFGDLKTKTLGRKHFANLPTEDLLEHPLSHYTETDEDQPRGRHDHQKNADRQRCARRQAMSSEYQRNLANLLKDIVVEKLKRQKMMRLSSTRKHMVI